MKDKLDIKTLSQIRASLKKHQQKPKNGMYWLKSDRSFTGKEILDLQKKGIRLTIKL